MHCCAAGGYAGLQRVMQWNLDFMARSDQGEAYRELANRCGCAGSATPLPDHAMRPASSLVACSPQSILGGCMGGCKRQLLLTVLQCLTQRPRAEVGRAPEAAGLPSSDPSDLASAP